VIRTRRSISNEFEQAPHMREESSVLVLVPGLEDLRIHEPDDGSEYHYMLHLGIHHMGFGV
jgi:hypothetical protein